MDPERWQRLQQLFEQAVGLPPEQRAALLAAEPDAHLRAEVQALLGADAGLDEGSDAVERVVGEAARGLAQPLQPDRVGPWRLLDELGAGGMGTVYRAERADGAYQRTVAIKFLRGFAGQAGGERMRRERQILADLDHPHIAGLLDGGSTEQGQPYLVMEFVDGVPIDAYARGIPLDRRLRLLQQVARAVHAAHQRLVVHRDIKPANVLVRADGTPVLLDFGIAKLLDEAEAGSGGQTAWFTPGYASPEQRRGEAVSTASDVYALGQLLAELLAGHHVPPAADGQVAAPSARGLAGLPRRRLRELDAIVQQACAPQARDRYPSAEALAEDIERWFQHEPLRAAPARPWYLLATFLRRHRYAAAATLGVVLALSLLAGRLASERDRALRAEAQAQEESATAEQVIQSLIALFREAAPDQARNQPLLPSDLVDRGRARIHADLAGRPVQRARLLVVLGDIDRELGQGDRAAEGFREAVAIERELGDPARLAHALMSLGSVENQNERPAAALPPLAEAVGLLRKLPESQLELGQALGAQAIAQARLGHGDDALPLAEESLRLARGLEGDTTGATVMALQVLADVAKARADHATGIAAAGEAVDLIRRQPGASDQDLATALGFLANAHVSNEDPAAAEPLFREMLALRLRTLDPGSAWAVTARNNLAHAIYVQGRILEALPLMQENVDLLRARGEDDTPSFLVALNNVASLHESTGNYAASVAGFEELMAKAQALADPLPAMAMAQYRQNLGRSLMLANRLDAAWPWLSAAIDEDATTAGAPVEAARQQLHLGDWMRRQGRFEEAASHLEQAGQLFATWLPPEHPRRIAVQRAQAQLALDRGESASAVAMAERALAAIEDALGRDTNAAIETRLLLGSALLARGDRARLRRVLGEGLDRVDALFVAEAPAQATLRRLRAAARDGSG